MLCLVRPYHAYGLECLEEKLVSKLPPFGLNRLDYRSPDLFAADARRAEELGWGWACIPASSMLIRDPYINLAFAAKETSHIGLCVLLANPVVRGPGVLANSTATVAEMAPGRTQLCLGVGDTAVRLLGSRPAKVTELEAATRLTRALLAGEEVEVGAARPARMFRNPGASVWIAAGGPKTLRMAGRVADGVWIRVGRHRANLEVAYAEVEAGAREAGRDPQEVQIGLIFHTLLNDDEEAAGLMARSMAAGFYEYSPMLFDIAGFTWDGPDVHELQQQVWPDFHHHGDLVESGKVVSFLSDEIAASFSMHGTPESIASQYAEVLGLGYRIDAVVAHPMPTPTPGGPRPDYMERFATEVMPLIERKLGG